MRNHGCGEGRGYGRGYGRMGRKMAMLMAMQAGARWGGGWGGERDDGGQGGRDYRDRDWGGRGRWRGRMFAGGELRLLLLRLIADQSRHGYELIKAIEELTGGQYAPSPGVVYPTLALLADEGRIAEATGEGQTGGGRKAFTATDEGFAELADRDEEAKALVARLQALGDRERSESPPVRRAVANLMIALRQRAGMGAGGGALDTETSHAIADILDEAARKIERL